MVAITPENQIIADRRANATLADPIVNADEVHIRARLHGEKNRVGALQRDIGRSITSAGRHAQRTQAIRDILAHPRGIGHHQDWNFQGAELTPAFQQAPGKFLLTLFATFLSESAVSPGLAGDYKRRTQGFKLLHQLPVPLAARFVLLTTNLDNRVGEGTSRLGKAIYRPVILIGDFL